MGNYQKELKQYLENEDIVDIVVFGSSVKGKIMPNDIDIAVLVKKKLSFSLLKEIKKSLGKNGHIQQVSINDKHIEVIVRQMILLREGHSIKHKKYIHELYGIKPKYLYTYSLKSLSASQKVMFHRGIKTISDVDRLSNRVVMVPVDNANEFEDFLKQWDLDIEAKEYSLLPKLRKEEI